MGISLRRRGREWREAKRSEMQDWEVPESTRAVVRMGFRFGKLRVIEMRKCSGSENEETAWMKRGVGKSE